MKRSETSTKTSRGSLSIDVMDNGRGFAPQQPTGGFGLLSMRERAELIGATLRVDSAARDGTRVSLVVPLRNPAS